MMDRYSHKILDPWSSTGVRCLLVLGIICGERIRGEDTGQPTDANVIAARVPNAETGSESDHMTGDWRGLRTRLVESGFHFQAGYSGEFFSNLSGGKKRGTVYEGLLELSLDVNPSKFSRWKGATLHVSSLYPHGASPSGQLVGDLSTVSNIDAYDSVKLFEWWMEQHIWQEQISLRAGQLAADEEFAISQFSGALLNADFGWPSFIALNIPTPAFPVAALGARAHWKLNDNVYFQGGVYDGNPDPGDAEGKPINQHGTRIKLNGEEGAMAIAELGFELPGTKDEEGLSGWYKLGAWYHTAKFDHLREDGTGLSLADPSSSGEPKALNGNWGIYAMADQFLWKENSEIEKDDQGLAMFGRVGGSPSDRSLVEFNLNFGFHYLGLLPGRDMDVAEVGLAWLDLSDEAGKLARESGEVELDYEVALEITYRISVQPWWQIQPDLQYVIHPGGSSGLADAFVIGMRSSLTF